MTHISTLTLHRLRYGELDEAERERTRAHLAGCARCAARLGVQEQERATFVLRPVPEVVRAPPGESGLLRRFLREMWPFGLAAVAAAAVSVSVPVLRGAAQREVPDQIRARGVLPQVEAWVDDGRGPRPMHPGEALAPGDRVQLRYDTHGARHVALAGRDVTGLVEIYTLTAPSGDGLTTAPFALELDAAPGRQELFVVTGERPLDEATVRAALTGTLPGITVASLAFPKHPGPR
jgi:anti-sigma factor RsiW